MKKLCLLFVFLILLCTLATPVLAEQNQMPEQISGNTYYDFAQETFLYYVNPAAPQAVRCSVADGMITEQSVSIKTEAGVALDIYLDGERISGVSTGVYKDPGEYVVMYVGGTSPERLFSFTIVPKICNYVTGYGLPAGFEFVDATLDDQAVAFDKNYIKLTEEGLYNIHYRCIKTDVPYQLRLRTDYTGPTLSLEEVQDGKARGPVDISEAKDAAYVTIYHDGDVISRKDVLTESGQYYIELADEAGNKTTYTFTILIYFDGSSWLFFVLVIGSCVGLIIYLVHSRKHLRVR